MDEAALIRAALDCGADGAELVPGTRLVTSDSLRRFCEDNVCGYYGRCWSCPPDAGEASALIGELKKYGRVLIYQVISRVCDLSDAEELNAAGARLTEVSQRLQDHLRSVPDGEFLHLGGVCRLCPECARIKNEPCRYPERLIPSLSAYCVDVRKTCEGTSLEYTNGENTVTNFGMVLFNE